MTSSSEISSDELHQWIKTDWTKDMNAHKRNSGVDGNDDVEQDDVDVPTSADIDSPKNQAAQPRVAKESPKKQAAPRRVAKESPKKQAAPRRVAKESPKNQAAPRRVAKESPKSHRPELETNDLIMDYPMHETQTNEDGDDNRSDGDNRSDDDDNGNDDDDNGNDDDDNGNDDDDNRSDDDDNRSDDGGNGGNGGDTVGRSMGKEPRKGDNGDWVNKKCSIFQHAAETITADFLRTPTLFTKSAMDLFDGRVFANGNCDVKACSNVARYTNESSKQSMEIGPGQYCPTHVKAETCLYVSWICAQHMAGEIAERMYTRSRRLQQAIVRNVCEPMYWVIGDVTLDDLRHRTALGKRRDTFEDSVFALSLPEMRLLSNTMHLARKYRRAYLDTIEAPTDINRRSAAVFKCIDTLSLLGNGIGTECPPLDKLALHLGASDPRALLCCDAIERQCILFEQASDRVIEHIDDIIGILKGTIVRTPQVPLIFKTTADIEDVTTSFERTLYMYSTVKSNVKNTLSAVSENADEIDACIMAMDKSPLDVSF